MQQRLILIFACLPFHFLFLSILVICFCYTRNHSKFSCNFITLELPYISGTYNLIYYTSEFYFSFYFQSASVSIAFVVQIFKMYISLSIAYIVYYHVSQHRNRFHKTTKRQSLIFMWRTLCIATMRF